MGSKSAREFSKRDCGTLDIAIRAWISRQSYLASLSICFPLFLSPYLFSVFLSPFFVLITSFLLSSFPDVSPFLGHS